MMLQIVYNRWEIGMLIENSEPLCQILIFMGRWPSKKSGNSKGFTLEAGVIIYLKNLKNRMSNVKINASFGSLIDLYSVNWQYPASFYVSMQICLLSYILCIKYNKPLILYNNNIYCRGNCSRKGLTILMHMHTYFYHYKFYFLLFIKLCDLRR